MAFRDSVSLSTARVRVFLIVYQNTHPSENLINCRNILRMDIDTDDEILRALAEGQSMD